MAESIREVKIKLGLDKSEVDRGLPEVERSFGSLLKGGIALGAGIAAATVAFRTLLSTIDRGQAFSELNNAFKNLYGSSLVFSRDGLGTLRTALKGTVSDLDILKSANIAAQSGLSPDAFKQLASAAENLGDVVGKNAATALEELSRGLSLGQEKLLKSYGITVDNTKANQEFAKSIGTTADKLNEAGKLAAFQAEALKQLSEKAKNAGDNAETAGDIIERLGVSLENMGTVLADLINNSSAVKGFFGIIESGANIAADAVNDLALALNGPNFANLSRSFGNVTSLAEIEAQRERIKSAQAAAIKSANDLLADPNSSSAEIDKYLNLTKVYEKELFNLQERYDQLRQPQAEINKQYIDAAKGSEEAAKKADELAKSIAGINAQVQQSKLGDLLSEATSGNLVVNFDEVARQYKESLRKATLEQLGSNSPEAQRAAENLAQLEVDKLTEARLGANYEMAKDQEEKMKEAFQNSVDFWSDILTSASEDAAFNIEDILTDALKRVAIGFGSSLLASLTGIGSGGLTAGGLGQTLASSLLSSVGGFGGIAGSLGLGGLLTGTSGIGPVISGDIYSGMLGMAGTSGALGTGGLGGLLTGANPYLLGAGALYYGLDKLGVWEGNFGGTTNEETMNRRNARGRLQQTGLGEDLTFRGVYGNVSLFDQDYNVSQNQFSSQATGLVNPLASIFSGGDSKLQNDLAGIFTNAVSEGKNFTEVLLNVQGLMDGLGITAEEAKAQLSQTFLDGTISLDEFQAGVANLNILAQDTFPIADAIAIIGDAASSNRAKLKGLEVAFREMANIGIDTTSEVSAYLIDQFGPNIVAVFDLLRSSGIDSFEDVKNASADQIAVIFEALQTLDERIGTTFSNASETIADQIEQGTQASVDALNRLGNKAEDTAKRVNNSFKGAASAASGNASGADPNPPNNNRAA